MLSPQIILFAIVSYFLILTAISYFTCKEDNNETFFNAKRSSNWAVVAFGMVGASLSGLLLFQCQDGLENHNLHIFKLLLDT